VILISGIPGAGKTTVGRLLAQGFERSVHIEGDLLQRMIVAGGEWPRREISPEAERQLRLRARNGCLLANSFSDGGFTVALDDVLIAFRLDDYVSLLAGRRLYYVLLLPESEAVRARNRSRENKDVFDAWQFLDAEVRRTERRGLWLDSTDLDAAGTASLIRARLEEALIRA
jgi:cytidylate kinase